MTEKGESQKNISALYDILEITTEQQKVRSPLAAIIRSVDEKSGVFVDFKRRDERIGFIACVLNAYGVHGPLEGDFFEAIPVRAIQLPEKLWEKLIGYADLAEIPERHSEIPQEIREVTGL